MRSAPATVCVEQQGPSSIRGCWWRKFAMLHRPSGSNWTSHNIQIGGKGGIATQHTGTPSTWTVWYLRRPGRPSQCRRKCQELPCRLSIWSPKAYSIQGDEGGTLRYLPTSCGICCSRWCLLAQTVRYRREIVVVRPLSSRGWYYLPKFSPRLPQG